MGYGTTGRFLQDAHLFDACNIKAGASICSLGDQTAPVKSQGDLDYIRRFIEHYNQQYDAKKYEPFLGKRLHVSMVYRDAGFSYVSVDLNEEDDALPIDLNFWPNSALPDKQFDVVTNHGTTEHVGNQLTAYAAIHYLTKPNGLMMHYVPILHFSAHAMAVVTPLFIKKLIDGNRYEIIEAAIRAHEVGDALAFHHMPEYEFIDGFTDTIQKSTLGGLVWLALKKTSDAAFVPPLDVGAADAKVKPIIEHYINEYGGPSNERERASALDQYLSKKPTPTEMVVQDVADAKKRIDRSQLISISAVKSSDSTTATKKDDKSAQEQENWQYVVNRPQSIFLHLPPLDRSHLRTIALACGTFLLTMAAFVLMLVYLASLIVR